MHLGGDAAQKRKAIRETQAGISGQEKRRVAELGEVCFLVRDAIMQRMHIGKKASKLMMGAFGCSILGSWDAQAKSRGQGALSKDDSEDDRKSLAIR